MKYLQLDNYIIDTPITEILNDLKATLINGKLKDIKINVDDIAVTCPNSEHAGGKEHHPDCHINLDPDNNNVEYGHFHCFACQAAGSFIKFVALFFDSSEEYAKTWLINHYGKQKASTILLDDSINVFNNTKKIF